MKHRSRLVEKVKQLLKRKWGKQLRYILTFCIILFCINLSFSPIAASNTGELPTSGTGGEHITWNYDVETKILTFTGYGKTGTLSGWYDMHGSVENCGDWYVLREDVEKLIFSEGITEIANSAFKDFVKLKEVEFSSTITTIGNEAFLCSGLEKITIPSTIKKVGSDAFRYSQLKEVVIEEGVKEIGMLAFAWTDIEELTLPQSIKECPALTSNCVELKTINFPDNMEVLMGEWFESCPKLRKVKLPKSIKWIRNGAFDSSNLESITIPENVKKLGGYSSSLFLSCKKLKKVVIKSKKIKTIYPNAFYHFPKKATIYVPNSKKKEYTKMFRKAKLPKKVKIKAIKDMKK